MLVEFLQKAIFKSYNLNWKTYYVPVTRKILLSHFKNLQKHKLSEMAASIEEIFAQNGVQKYRPVRAT